MKHKPESWNSATPESQRGVRRSLSFTRAGLQLGQLSHIVSGALGGSNPRGAAQVRMRELLNQDRALLSHRACGQALLLDDADAAPEVPTRRGKSRSAAQSRMRDLLNQDRALLALRRGDHLNELDEPDELDELDELHATRQSDGAEETLSAGETDRAAAVEVGAVGKVGEVGEVGKVKVEVELEATKIADDGWEQAPVGVFHASVATVARGSCVGAMTSFDVSDARLQNARVAQHVQHVEIARDVVEPESATVVGGAPAEPTDVAAAAAKRAVPAEVTEVIEVIALESTELTELTESTSAAGAVDSAGAAQTAQAPEKSDAAQPAGAGDPIRTRSMAKLLAMQGYRDRALSIYEELIAREPENADLRAEADRLRN